MTLIVDVLTLRWISCLRADVSLLHEAVAPLLGVVVPDGVQALIPVVVVHGAFARDEAGLLNHGALRQVACTVVARPKDAVLVAREFVALVPAVVALVPAVVALVVEAASLVPEVFSQAGIVFLSLVVLALIVVGGVALAGAGASVAE